MHGAPMYDMQKVIALRGIIPKELLDRADDTEDSLRSYAQKLRWAERQIERARA